MTPLCHDFLPDNFTTKSGSVQQLSGKTSVKGSGPVHWCFKLPDTNEHDILPIAHHIPSSGIRLFISQAYFKQCKGGSLTLDHEACTFVLPTGVSFSIPYQSSSNLPLLYPIPTASSLIEGYSLSLFSFKSLNSDSINSSIVDETNQNITPTQKELLIWHWRLAHAGFAWIQSLFQPRVFVTSQQGEDTKEDSVISPKHPTSYKCSAPKCTSCCVSKSKQYNIHKTASSPLSKYLSINTTLPGEKLFVD